MGLFDLFTYKYDLRATVELEDGKKYQVRCPIEARFVTDDELLDAFKREVKRRLGSPVKRIIEMYDASEI